MLDREVALEHFAYFPGAVITAAAWRLLPEPFDDQRLLVLLCNLGMLAAALAFRGPLAVRIAVGALLVCNPIAVRSAWFGQNDAPSLLLLVLAFALASRRRFGWAAATLAGAILLKQFAVVALPFLALMLWQMDAERDELKRAALAFGGVLAVGILPFLVADPVAFYDDTVRYGAGTYRIVGYGLSAILVEAGVVADRDGAYPFALLALLTWLPLTVWLLLAQRRAGGALARRGRLRGVDPVADVHRADVQQLLPRVADDRRRNRRSHGHGGHDAQGGTVSARRVVVLPGLHYSSQAPLLSFAREAAQAAGWSVIEVGERAPAAGAVRWMREQAERALAAAGAERVAVVGKSLGSAAAAPLVAERGLPAVWLTPLLIRPDVVAGLNAASAPALLVGSLADPTWSDGEQPANDVLEVLEPEGLDHSCRSPATRRPRSRCCAR